MIKDPRAAVAVAIKRGDLTRSPCRICGNPKSQAHHTDYSKPLDIDWLCRKHHREEHARLYRAGVTIPGFRPMPIMVQFAPEVRRKIELLAKKEYRSLSNMLKRLVNEALQARNGKAK